MRKPTPRRKVAAAVAVTLATFALGATVAAFVGSAAAASPQTTTTTTTDLTPTVPDTPGSSFFVINATVNAASDHEIVGSSAFPNFTTGAVDNYYSMAHSHVDNSPFAEGTASSADTGPVGQTAAAGNFQQPQYADARWPGGDSGKATYGNQGGPYAVAEAGEYQATADASEATNPLSSPGAPGKLATPKVIDLRLRQALAGWKAKWLPRLSPTKPSAPGTVPKPTLPVPKPTLPVTRPKIAPSHPTLTTPVATVTTPHAAVGGANVAPPVNVPPPPTTTPTLPSLGAEGSSRQPASFVPRSPASGSAPPPADGEWLLTSSTSADLVVKGHKTTKVTTATGKTKTVKTKTYALVTRGESSLGRVSLAGGQIVIRGIHVTASISNDGSPTYQVTVTVAAASIGGIPVTIDQDGVHVAGQGQALPYQQASDALNGVLKQAGIQLFLVAPEVTDNTCGSGGGTGTDTTSTTTTSSSDQSGGTDTSSCGQPSSCDQSGTGTDTGTTSTSPIPAPGSQTGTTDTTSSCSCDQTGTGMGTGATTTTMTPTDQSSTTDTTSSCSPPPACDQTGTGMGSATTTTTSTTTSSQWGGTDTTSSCAPMGTTSTTGACAPAGTTPGTTTSAGGWSGATTPSGSSDFMGPNAGMGFGMGNSGGETVTATGVHVVFTQPVNQSGVPSQFVEHVLGEVFLDSLAVPAGPLPDLGLASSYGSFSSPSSSSSSSSSSPFGSSCGGGASAAGGGSSFGGSGSSGSLGSSGSAFGSGSQPTAGAAGGSLPAVLAAALRKPLWLLLAYLLWQAVVIGTGASLWNWRRGDAS